MADVEDRLESPICQTTIGLGSPRDGTPNSFCSTPELEIIGNESCSVNDSKQSPNREGSPAFISSETSLSNEANTTLIRPKIKELGNFKGPSTGVDLKETRREGSKSSLNKDQCGVECKWISCHVILKNAIELSEHVKTAHVEPMSKHQDVFVCLWEGCKVFDKPSLSHTWLAKHVNVHTGAKPFKCMISGCSMTFSSREGLARHVPSHFNDAKPTKRQKSDNDSSPKKVMKKKKKKMKNLRQAKPPPQVKEDFIDQHAVSSIKEKLPHVMPVSCYRLGIDGANIVFQSKVLGRRTEEKSGEEDVLLRWLPEDILPDEWVPLNEVQKHRTRTVHISQLPNDVAADLDPSFYRQLSHRKHHRK